MSRQRQAQQKAVERVMHEFKHGDLSRPDGGKVRNRKQAIAIALGEAGASNRQKPQQNKRRQAATRDTQRQGETRDSGPTRAELYREAAKRNIAGRSAMSKAALHKALQADRP